MTIEQKLIDYTRNPTFRSYLGTNALLRLAYDKACRGMNLTEEEAMEVNEAWSSANEP